MKKTILTLLATVAIGATASAQTLLYNWNFDSQTSNVTSPTTGSGGGLTMRNSGGTTDLLGASGSGVSGQSGDRALVTTVAGNAGNTGIGQIAQSSTGNVDLSSLATGTQFTITLWAKLSDPGYYGRLLNVGPTAAYDGAADGVSIKSYISGGQNQLEVNIDGATTNLFGTLANPGYILNQWSFIGITYNSVPSTNNLTVYTASVGGSTSVLGTFTANMGNIAFTSSAFAMVGNRDNLQRGFAGSVDDYRIYSGVADQAFLDGVVASVPEPATWLLLAGSLCAVVFLRRRRC